ncbi:MAG: gamma-glutamyl-gamma-aminobutyrate hydrolase family protein [Erysipelotrichaceae bacterium]|nr:gamma-glutamyl-gamma-aminobutyrate hydrolase family protein [Erysipelotrichaceae bacterium]
MKKPVIGIVAKPQVHRENDYWHRLEMVDEIRYLLIKHGAIGVMLLPSEATMGFNDNDLGDVTVLTAEQIDDLHRQLELVDGLILQGGDYSCQYEVELAKMALEKDMPVLGICAGFNNLLRALGTNTFEDRSAAHSHYDTQYRHHITVVKGTKLHELVGSDDYEVNSFHQMVATRELVEPCGKISSYSDDGLVESFELPDKRFTIGVKWHPEQMREDYFTDRLFSSFTEECRRTHE